MNTIRQAYIDILTETNKEASPVLYLEDFLYFYNKAVSEYMKLRYEKFELTQQLTDDLRAWKTEYSVESDKVSIADIPDYRHLLNCILQIELYRPDVACNIVAGEDSLFKATRMTSNIKAGLLDNVYLAPKFYRPYFDIIGDSINIYMGKIPANKLKKSIIHIEYLRQPAKIDLTAEQLKEDEDTSQVFEFSTDVAEEITKRALMLILERGSDPRLQTHSAVNKSVNDISLGGK